MWIKIITFHYGISFENVVYEMAVILFSWRWVKWAPENWNMSAHKQCWACYIGPLSSSLPTHLKIGHPYMKCTSVWFSNELRLLDWKIGHQNKNHSDVIMGAMASQTTSLTIVYSTVYSGADQEENIKAPRHWPLCGEVTVTGEFPTQRASNAENVSVWWRHHEFQKYSPGWHVSLLHIFFLDYLILWGRIIRYYSNIWYRRAIITTGNSKRRIFRLFFICPKIS